MDNEEIEGTWMITLTLKTSWLQNAILILIVLYFDKVEAYLLGPIIIYIKSNLNLISRPEYHFLIYYMTFY